MPAECAGALAQCVVESESWADWDPADLSPFVDLACALLHLGVHGEAFVEGVSAHAGAVPVGEPEMAQIVVRVRAALFLAVGGDVGEVLGPWVEMVRQGWFSTPYLALLTVLCFRRVMGDGQNEVGECVAGLEQDRFPSIEAPWNRAVFGQPPGMEALLAPYLGS
jgi:hypothetical protein